ncbi:MAG: lipid-A-disaccharide synthase [Blastocatellia bacterium AA13]|nr:MAG: lipid-A-disaccharide synthase [Blastocatellia bacterium AA13]
MNRRLSIMLVAGEASGDKHGAALAKALQRLYPDFQFDFFGSGGSEMRAAGVETLVDVRDVGIIGVLEVARALGRLYRAYRKLVAAAIARKPAAVVLIDWPDFNLRLARRLSRLKFRITYYISPQVWAWRTHRVKAIKKYVDRMLVILPFEEEFYRGAGVEAQFVGHPLAGSVVADASPAEFARKHSLDPSKLTIALLPGSRPSEIHYHLPIMLEAAESLTASSRDEGSADLSSLPRFPADEIQFVVPVASTIPAEQIDRMIAAANSPVKSIRNDTYNALAYSKLAVVASGTATVEAALLGTPMIVIYRGSELSYRLIRPLIKLNTFAMVNLIAGKRIVPELIQGHATGKNIARTIYTILSDAQQRAAMKADLELVRARLLEGGTDASERAARAVMRMATA